MENCTIEGSGICSKCGCRSLTFDNRIKPKIESENLLTVSIICNECGEHYNISLKLITDKKPYTIYEDIC